MTEKQKEIENKRWSEQHILTREQVRQLLENKFRRAVSHLEASQTIKDLILEKPA